MPRYERPLRERKRRIYRGLILGCMGCCLAAGMCQAAYAQKIAEPDPQACIVYHGEPLLVPAGISVGEILAAQGLTVEADDRLSVGENTILGPGELLRIDCVQQQQQTYTVPIPRETVYCVDKTLPAAGRETILNGRDGELLRTAKVTYVNGQEVHREVLTEQVHQLPVSAVVAYGRAASTEMKLPRIENNTITLPTGEVLTYTHTAPVRATAYTHTDKGCNMVTATGSKVHIGTVAVDPRYIPYGTRMFIMASDGSYIYGIAEAEDCGGDIIGDRMDLYMPTYEACMAFGRRLCTVYFLG